MKNAIKEKHQKQVRRAHRTRARIHGTASIPRLSVSRSIKLIEAQLIDDDSGKTLASASDRKVEKGTKVERATEVGTQIAAAAKAAGIESVVFDRGGNKYLGRVKAVAEAARAGGLKF